jgi:hypothetical protein
VGLEHPPERLHTPHKNESPPGYLHRTVRKWALPTDISLTPTQSLDLRTARPTDTKILVVLTAVVWEQRLAAIAAIGNQ